MRKESLNSIEIFLKFRELNFYNSTNIKLPYYINIKKLLAKFIAEVKVLFFLGGGVKYF